MNGESNGLHNSGVRWLLGLLFSVIFGTLGWLSGVVMHHEGAIGRWDSKIENISHTLERLEQKMDELREKK